MKKAIEEHWKHDYFYTLEGLPHIRGVKLKLPANLILGLASDEFLYEIDKDTVNIYNNKKKIESHYCPEYACRNFVILDIMTKVEFYEISPFLLKTSNDLNNEKPITLISPPPSERDKNLEELLQIYLSGQGSEQLPPEEIREGYNLLFEHFIKEY